MKFFWVYTKNYHNNYQLTTKQQDSEGEHVLWRGTTVSPL